MAEYIYRTRFVSCILEKRRIHRIKSVLGKVHTWPNMSILDVGSGPDGRSFADHVSGEYKITGIDLLEPSEVHIKHPQFKYHKLDAKDLSMFESKSFDLAISIGMMEHICNRELLEQMAKEIERVANQWIIIVPWKYCLIEPHFKFPFFPLFPERIQLALTQLFNLHDIGYAVKRDPSFIRKTFQWLSSKEWESIFKADCSYVLPTLDTLAIVKKES